MSTSYATLSATLQHGAQHTLHTAADVDAVVSAAAQLVAHHHRRLASPWSVPRLLSSVLRTQLSARMAAARSTPHALPLSCLLDLLVETWRLCPLVTLPPPPSTSSTSAAAAVLKMTQTDVDRVEGELAELRRLSASCHATDDVHRTALSLLLALLTYWHIIAAEEEEIEESGCDGEDFYGVSETVWRCVHRWTATSASAGARSAAITTWLSTILRRALRTGAAAPLFGTVEWLDHFLATRAPDEVCASATSSPSLPPTASPAASLDAYWAQLHLRVFRHVSADLHTSQSLLKKRWAANVAPVLTRALAHEPPLLSGAALRPFDFGPNLEDSLGLLVREAGCLVSQERASDGESSLTSCAPSLSCVLQLTSLQQRAEAAGLFLTPFVSSYTYETYVRPVAAVALRLGVVEVAAALLTWAERGLDAHGREWRRRLAGDVDAAAALERREDEAWNGGRYSQWLGQRLRAPCTFWNASQALDIMVSKRDDVHALRLVCDAALRCASPQYTPVLRDPFAPLFLLRSLSSLATHFLAVGDVPLARYYLALQGQLLPRYVCPPALLDFLRVVERCAHVVSCQHLSPPTSATPSNAQDEAVAYWKRVDNYLGTVDLPDNAAALPESRRAAHRFYTAGAAWKARRNFQVYCTGEPAPHRERHREGGVIKETEREGDSCGALSGAVVEVCYDPQDGEGALWLRWAAFNAAAPQDDIEDVDLFTSSCVVRCASVDAALRGCVAGMAAVVQCNRQQLLRGSSPAVEKALCADSQGGLHTDVCDSSSTLLHSNDAAAASVGESSAASHRWQKEAWWTQRYALDARVGGVAATLQNMLRVCRVLLAGRPGPALTAALSTISTNFAARCAELRTGRPCPSLTALQHATMRVVLAGPSLWSSSHGPTDAQPTCFHCLSSGSACVACAATRRAACTTLLAAVVELGHCIEDTFDFPREGNHHGCRDVCAEDEKDAWLSLLLDADVVAAAQEVAAAALDAFYVECAQHTTPTPPSSSSHVHLDVLLHPREHVYLVLGGELHGLPWEGIDVTAERSISRVPSRAYLQHAARCFSAGVAVSLRRTLVYRDSDARDSNVGNSSSGAGLSDLLARRPAWDVHYGDTLRSASAAQDDGAAESTSPLLDRLLGPHADAHHLDAYVYGGHKGGEHLLPRAGLYEWMPAQHHAQPSLVLLMGCSSARLFSSAVSDGFGLPLAYLSAGVSCMVGCVWDVTDGDVDRLTYRFLECAAERRTTVGEALAVARRACKLRCLTGLATVFYGLNLPIVGAAADDGGRELRDC